METASLQYNRYSTSGLNENFHLVFLHLNCSLKNEERQERPEIPRRPRGELAREGGLRASPGGAAAAALGVDGGPLPAVAVPRRRRLGPQRPLSLESQDVSPKRGGNAVDVGPAEEEGGGGAAAGRGGGGGGSPFCLAAEGGQPEGQEERARLGRGHQTRGGFGLQGCECRTC